MDPVDLLDLGLSQHELLGDVFTPGEGRQILEALVRNDRGRAREVKGQPLANEHHRLALEVAEHTDQAVGLGVLGLDLVIVKVRAELPDLRQAVCRVLVLALNVRLHLHRALVADLDVTHAGRQRAAHLLLHPRLEPLALFADLVEIDDLQGASNAVEIDVHLLGQVRLEDDLLGQGDHFRVKLLAHDLRRSGFLRPLGGNLLELVYLPHHVARRDQRLGPAVPDLAVHPLAPPEGHPGVFRIKLCNPLLQMALGDVGDVRAFVVGFGLGSALGERLHVAHRLELVFPVLLVRQNPLLP